MSAEDVVRQEVGKQHVFPIETGAGTHHLCESHAREHLQYRPDDPVGQQTQGRCMKCAQGQSIKQPRLERDKTVDRLSPYHTDPMPYGRRSAPFTPLRQSLNAATPICDQPECQPPYRGGVVPSGHYGEDGEWQSHAFDETNHPSHAERQRLRDEREKNDPEHIRQHGDLLFHGTSYENARAISDHGFTLDNTTNGRHSGEGVYLTKSIREARQYGDHVVHAKVLTDHLHPNPYQDEDLATVPVEHLHHAVGRQGYIGHVDPDDGAHIVYNPKHVVPIAVQTPDRPRHTAAIEQEHHTIYRGLRLGGANFVNALDPHGSDEHILEHLHRANDVHKRWSGTDVEHPLSTPYGRHWTSDHEQARRFATHQIQNLQHRPPPHGPHDRYGVVLEAHTGTEPQHDSLMQGYGEQEIERPHRKDIHAVTAHLHVLRGLEPGDTMHHAREKRNNTYVRSIPVPDHLWRTASTEEPCTCCGGSGEHPSGHECYRCDASGQEVGATGTCDAQTMSKGAEKKDPRFEGVSLKQDDDGWYVQTHRARSDSYPSPEKIPESKIEFIRSTGAVRTPPEGPNGEEPTGIMVAIVPPKRVVRGLPLPDGGEHPENVHVTLAYLGDKSEHTGEQVRDLPELIEAWAETQPRLEARVQGVGTFINEGSHVLWAAVDIPGVNRMHVDLVDYLASHGFTVKDNHSFTPHLTLSYEERPVRFLPKVEPTSFTVREVWCCIGGRWESYRLKGRG